jgi:hypothetical protein
MNSVASVFQLEAGDVLLVSAAGGGETSAGRARDCQCRWIVFDHGVTAPTPERGARLDDERPDAAGFRLIGCSGGGRESSPSVFDDAKDARRRRRGSGRAGGR